MEELSPELYNQLRTIAHRLMQNEKPGHTLQPTALVHEAFVRLRGSAEVPSEESRFRALAAVVMRRILIDWARAKKTAKRGGSSTLVTVPELNAAADEQAVLDVLGLEDALTKMESLDPRAAEIVTLRFFGGLREEEVAEHIGVSSRTIRKEWAWARTFLGDVLG